MLRFYAVRCLLLNPLLFTIPKTVPAPFSDPRIRFRGSHKRIRTQSVLSHTACRLSRSTSLHRRGLGLGPKAVAGQRGRPHNARRREVARARQEKKDKIIIFFSHIATGNGGLWKVSEAPKYFGEG